MDKIPTLKVSAELIRELIQSIHQVRGYGSVEVYIQDHTITQITVRSIKKTSAKLSSNNIKSKQTLDKPISLY
jgi:hypothetical protein